MIKKTGKFRKGLSVAGMVLIMFLVITAGIDAPVRKAGAVCIPEISGDWEPTFTVLLNALTKNQLVAQEKSLLAKELNLEYSIGSMMTSMANDLTNGAVTGSDLTTALDFDTTPITTVLNDEVTKEKEYINSNIKLSVFESELNTDLRTFLNTLIWGYLKLNTIPQTTESKKYSAYLERKAAYNSFINSTYSQLLTSSVITNIYKPYVISLHDSMYTQMDLNAGYCAEMANLGSKQDINDHINGTNKYNTKQAVNECDKEATKGIKVVIDTSGEALKTIMNFTIDESGVKGFKGEHGNDLLDLLRSTFDFTLQLNSTYKCDGSSINSGSYNDGGGSGACRNIVTLTNTEAVTYTSNFIDTIQADLLTLSAAGSGELMTKLLDKIDKSKELVATVVEAEKGVDVKIQEEWKNKLTSITGSLGDAAKWKNLVKSENVKVSDTENVAALMAGDTAPAKRTKNSVQSFVVAEEAMRVAANIKTRLKGIDLSSIDAELDAQAWKDYARLIYYNLILENELLKLKAGYAMTYAGKSGGAGTVTEINK